MSRFIEEIPEDNLSELEEHDVSPITQTRAGKRIQSARVPPKAGSTKKTLSADLSGSNGETTTAGTPLADLAVGIKVKHAHFGEGTIIQVDGRGMDTTVTVAFPDQGIKKFMAGYTPLEKL